MRKASEQGDLAQALLTEASTPALQEKLLAELESLAEGYKRDPDLYAELQDLIKACLTYREAQGQGRDVQIVSAVPLNEDQQSSIRSLFEKKWKVPIRLKTAIDPTVIGGLRVAADSWEFDATVKGRLQALARHLQHS